MSFMVLRALVRQLGNQLLVYQVHLQQSQPRLLLLYIIYLDQTEVLIRMEAIQKTSCQTYNIWH